ncbi:hypothetical protein ACU4GD_36300 [Cupriavidus basilensis]
METSGRLCGRRYAAAQRRRRSAGLVDAPVNHPRPSLTLPGWLGLHGADASARHPSPLPWDCRDGDDHHNNTCWSAQIAEAVATCGRGVSTWLGTRAGRRGGGGDPCVQSGLRT